jgi:hypothetical protein
LHPQELLVFSVLLASSFAVLLLCLLLVLVLELLLQLLEESLLPFQLNLELPLFGKHVVGGGVPPRSVVQDETLARLLQRLDFYLL